MTLGDYLPQKVIFKLKEEHVKPGYIFRLLLNEDNHITTKDGLNKRHKYFIVMGTDEEGDIYGVVTINSQVNQNLSPALKQNFHKIEKQNYNFLDYDSYVDCNEFKPVKMNHLLSSDFNNSYKGKLNSYDFDKISDILRNAETVDPIDLINFGLI